MDQFNKSCFDAASYPGNLITANTFKYSLSKYAERLDKEEARLFCGGSAALVHIWKFEEGANSGFAKTSLAIVGILTG